LILDSILVPNRILHLLPQILFAGDKLVTPSNGRWDTRGSNLLTTAAGMGPRPWALIFGLNAARDEERGAVAAKLASMARGSLLAPRGPVATLEVGREARSLEEALGRAAAAKPAIIVVMLADKGTADYRVAKRLGDGELGIPTQCLVMGNFRPKGAFGGGGRGGGRGDGGRGGRGDARPGSAPGGGRGGGGRGFGGGDAPSDQYLSNVALKVNAKLGGTNWGLKPSLGKAFEFSGLSDGGRPFMVLGADVTHSGLSAPGPSVAALVGSTDRNALRYEASVWLQPFQARSP